MGGGRSLGARALLALISAGPMSRGDLAERLGLSAATTTRTVRPLIEAELIEEQPPVEVAGPGRPTRLLAVVPSSATVAGIKLTDDRLYAVLTDPLGEVLISDSRPLTDTDAGSVTALIASVVAQLAERSGRRPDAIGISLGAAVVGRRTVVVASFLGWRNVPLAAMVSEATGLPCVAATDGRAIGTAAGACLGTSTITTFVESSSGIAEGGRTGLTSVTTAVFFGLSLLLSPIFLAIPSFATAPALIMVGFYMFTSVAHMNFDEEAEAIPCYICILAMPFFYSISEGISMGVITYTALALIHGKAKKMSWLMYLLSLVFIAKYLFL